MRSRRPSPENGQVTIAPLELRHVDTLAQLQIDDHSDLVRVNPMPAGKPRLEELRYRLERGALSDPDERRSYVILVDGAVGGSITLNHIVLHSLQCAEVGIFVHSSHRGRGVGTAAIAQLCTVAFQQIGLHRLQAGVQPTNQASLRAFEKNGFQQIGIVKEMLFVDGAWRDHVLLQRLNPGSSEPSGEPQSRLD